MTSKGLFLSRPIDFYIMHTALVGGWADLMVLCELAIFDPFDAILDPNG